jgi:urease accessory protein
VAGFFGHRCAINIATPPPVASDLAPQPRARGAVRLGTTAGPRGTAIAHLRQAGSLKLVFPRAAPAVQAVLVNTAGGITGGDRFEVDIHAGAGSRLTLTTQAAERAYRAQPGSSGRLTTRLHAASGARLDWLPQETILFDGCDLSRRLYVDLESGADLLLAEPVVFGRAAMGERLTDARFSDAITIRRDGKPIYLDRLRFAGDVTAYLARPAIARGAGAMATLVYAAPDAEVQITPLRAVLTGDAGASLIAPDLLVMRLLAADGFALRQTLVPVLTRLSGQDLPRAWMT